MNIFAILFFIVGWVVLGLLVATPLVKYSVKNGHIGKHEEDLVTFAFACLWPVVILAMLYFILVAIFKKLFKA